jgi:hypothetical protein
MAVNGRASNGQFLHGHGFARGNPLNRRVQKLRMALLDAVTDDDIREVVGVLLTRAKGGDLAAIRELLNRTIGKPIAPVELLGADGEPLAGLTLADVQLAVVEALAEEPAAKVKVAEALRELHDRSRPRPAEDGAAP